MLILNILYKYNTSLRGIKKSRNFSKETDEHFEENIIAFSFILVYYNTLHDFGSIEMFCQFFVYYLVDFDIILTNEKVIL